MYGTFLTPILLSRLPENLRVLLSRKLEKDTWDLNEVITVFKEELILREKCACIQTAMTKTIDGKSGKKSNFKPPYQKHNLGTVSTLYSSKHGQPKIFCCFCKRGHQSKNCTAVTDAGARKRILRQKGKCYCCLRSGHVAASCTSSIKCSQCQGRDHVSVCSNNKSVGTEVQNQSNSSHIETQQAASSSNSTSISGINEHVTGFVGGRSSNKNTAVLLQTARTKLSQQSIQKYQ